MLVFFLVYVAYTNEFKIVFESDKEIFRSDGRTCMYNWLTASKLVLSDSKEHCHKSKLYLFFPDLKKKKNYVEPGVRIDCLRRNFKDTAGMHHYILISSGFLDQSRSETVQSL